MNGRRILGRAALALCTAAIAAPAAQAAFSDSGGGGGGRAELLAEHGRGGRVAHQDTRQAAKAGFRDYSAGGTMTPKQRRDWLKARQRTGRM